MANVQLNHTGELALLAMRGASANIMKLPRNGHAIMSTY